MTNSDDPLILTRSLAGRVVVEPRAQGRSGWLTARGEFEHALTAVPPDTTTALLARIQHHTGRLFFAGQGRSGLLAQMAAMRFMHLGVATHAVGEVTAPSIRGGDTLLIISGSGRTETSVRHARIAASEGAIVLLVTSQPGGPIHDLADESFVLDVAQSVQFGNTLFEHVALVLLDSIALELMRELDNPNAAMRHNHANLE